MKTIVLSDAEHATLCRHLDGMAKMAHAALLLAQALAPEMPIPKATQAECDGIASLAEKVTRTRPTLSVIPSGMEPQEAGACQHRITEWRQHCLSGCESVKDANGVWTA